MQNKPNNVGMKTSIAIERAVRQFPVSSGSIIADENKDSHEARSKFSSPSFSVNGGSPNSIIAIAIDQKYGTDAARSIMAINANCHGPAWPRSRVQSIPSHVR